MTQLPFLSTSALPNHRTCPFATSVPAVTHAARGRYEGRSIVDSNMERTAFVKKKPLLLHFIPRSVHHSQSASKAASLHSIGKPHSAVNPLSRASTSALAQGERLHLAKSTQPWPGCRETAGQNDLVSSYIHEVIPLSLLSRFSSSRTELTLAPARVPPHRCKNLGNRRDHCMHCRSLLLGLHLCSPKILLAFSPQRRQHLDFS